MTLNDPWWNLRVIILSDDIFMYILGRVSFLWAHLYILQKCYMSFNNKTSVSGRNPMRIYSHRTIKSLMDRPRFAQHKFEGWAWSTAETHIDTVQKLYLIYVIIMSATKTLSLNFVTLGNTMNQYSWFWSKSRPYFTLIWTTFSRKC